MKKRIKRNVILRIKVKWLESTLDYAIHEIIRQDKELEELKQINSRNVQATNSRFNKIEKQVANSNAKKSWFSRK